MPVLKPSECPSMLKGQLKSMDYIHTSPAITRKASFLVLDDLVADITSSRGDFPKSTKTKGSGVIPIQ